ncbi:hypothetical protein FACS189444_6430 [Spirochaetia bacterium]|nr:hypothetical protein FACS189444_6430 [Spirochaetia bacterium]
MTIQQTLTIPQATRHLTVDLPETVPAGAIDVVLSFPTPKQESENPWMNWDFHKTLPEPRSIEEALQMGAARAAAERADSSLGIARFQGCMKDSPTFFPGDAVEIISKMRDEWDESN